MAVSRARWRIGLLLAWSGWTFLWVLMGQRGGEFAAAAHLWVALSALPAGLLSLWLPHASIAAIVLAGALGLAQWLLVLEIAARLRR